MTTRTLLVWIATLGVISVPAWAQNAPAGPVHVPAGYATNAPADPAATSVAPVQSLLAPPVTNTPSAAPPAVNAPAPAASADDDGDIHDIRGPLVVPSSWTWVWYTATALALAAALYALWKWLRRTVIKPKLAHEIALERLEAARQFMTENQVREYAFAVSEIIRNYIEKRFAERAARRTTEEFLADLVKQTGTPLAEHRALLEDFLQHCDLPKFARWQLSVREMESMQESARAFILNTRPGAQPAPPPAQPELSPVA
jgi:hypothetical protein